MPTLLRIATDIWQLEIAGRYPSLPDFLPVTNDTTVSVGGDAKLQFFDPATNTLQILERGAFIKPLFFENVDYDFYFECSSDNVECTLPPASVLRHRLKNVTHYSINFRNEVGFTQISVAHAGRPTTIQFEVFPVKLDFRNDYIQMRDEISAIARNLVMTIQAKTFNTAAPVPAEDPTLVEWLSLLRHYFERYIASAKAILRHPHSQLVKVIEDVSADRCRRLSRRHFHQRMKKSNSRLVTLPGGIRVPARVPQQVQCLSFDTPENRYVKAVLRSTLQNLHQIHRSEATGDEDADLSAEQKFFQALRPHIRHMLSALQSVLISHPFSEVKDVPAALPPSLVLQRHPQYASFAAVARLLNSGLKIESNVLQIGVKHIALVYEYWCFLRLVSLLRKDFDLEQQTLVRLTHLKTTIVLTKGTQAAVMFRQKETGRRLVLIYNRVFPRLPTAAQQPDNVLQLATDRHLYVFDAKYRFAFDAGYQKTYGGVGPQVEDINTMHRYRDAIVSFDPVRSPPGFSSVVKGAIILFPYGDEGQFKKHQFFESIQKVDIGGLPFLPNATELVKQKLQSELKESGFSASSSDSAGGQDG